MINRIGVSRGVRGSAGFLTVIVVCSQILSASQSAWRKLSLAHSPSARVNMTMAYDPVGKSILLFGGYDGVSYLNDTWIFNGSDWVQLNPTSAPPVRSASAMSFDRVTGKMVLFGGYNGHQYLGDTWLWDGATREWTNANPATQPKAVTLPMLYIDPLNGHTGMVGGFDGNLYRNETWQWTGTDWLRLHPKTVLWARGAAVVANDVAHKKVVIFGGLADLNPNNTWTWNGVNWKMESPATQPPLVYYIPGAYDPDLGRVVMFAGASRQDATWTWTGDNWELVPALTPPPLMNSQGMAFDVKTNELIMFGGVIGTTIENYTYRLVTK